MKNLMENPMVCKAKDACKGLADIKIKNDYNMNISVYDSKNPESAECTHKMSGSIDMSLVKLLAVLGVASIALSAICGICSLFRD